jgi:hypothetical protein
MDTYSALQAVVVLVTALLGAIVTLWPPDNFRVKLVIVFVFLVLGIVAVWLQQQKENQDQRAAESDRAELLNWQRGDPKHPPYVGYAIAVDPASNVTTLQFLVQNPSDFPAYDIGIRLWDVDSLPKNPISIEDVVSRSIANVTLPALTPHIGQLIGRVDIPANVNAKKFGVQYSTRAGAFGETLRAQRVEGKWVFAIRVTRAESDEVVFRQVDPKYPLNAKGDVDW